VKSPLSPPGHSSPAGNCDRRGLLWKTGNVEACRRLFSAGVHCRVPARPRRGRFITVPPELTMRRFSFCLIGLTLIGGSVTSAQGLQKPFCMEKPGDWRTCAYDSLAKCQRAAAGRSDVKGCVGNPARFETTGRGGSGKNDEPPSRKRAKMPRLLHGGF
jgi:hypothetical protein